jgi:biotin carboxyl carrier protein
VTYNIDVNGRVRRVGVERAAGGFIVSVDGRRHAADVTVIDGLWSLIVDDDPPGAGLRRSYEVAVTEQLSGSGGLTIHVDGRLVSAAVAGTTRGSWGRRGHDGGSAAALANGAPQRVTAPMPGKVVKVLVRQGDLVAARQGVVVVEAMKMENELRAPKAGTVAAINVSEGASVDAGAVLVVIE